MAPLEVWLIFMQFPAPAETFAATDIHALRRRGVRIRAHGLRAEPPGRDRMLRDRGLSDLPVTHNTMTGSLRGAAAALARPTLLARFLAWALRHNWRRPGHLARTLLLTPRVFELFRLVERERPDVVHLFWGHYPAALGYLIATRLPGVVLSHFLGAYDLAMRYGGSPSVLRLADCVWTHADANLPALARIGAPMDRVRVVHRGMNVELCGGAPAGRRVTHSILTAGRLKPSKGFASVLRAFRIVHARYPDASLTILGQGPDRPRLEELAAELDIADAVRFRGHVEHREVIAELGRSQIFLFLSTHRSERLPNVVKEAMACGCVCVATATPGMDELIESGVHGEILPTPDPAAAAGVIGSLFENPERLSAMAEAGARRIRERFDVRAKAETYIATWTELRDARRGTMRSSEECACESGS